MNSWFSLSILEKILTCVMLYVTVGIIALIIGIFVKKVQPKRITKDGIEFKDDSGSTTESSNTTNDVVEFNKDNKPTLLKHRFFSLMDTLKIDGYVMHDVGDCDKKRISLVYLKDCMFKIVNEEVKKYVIELEKTNGKDMNKIISYINNTIDKYVEKSKTVTVELIDGTLIHGIPTVYIDRFDSWHYHHRELLFRNLQDILNDTFYPTWYDKASASLSALYDCIYMTVYDSNLTLGQLDGNLEKEIEKMKLEGKRK